MVSEVESSCVKPSQESVFVVIIEFEAYLRKWTESAAVTLSELVRDFEKCNDAMIRSVLMIACYLGPGKGPGFSFKHPSTRYIIQQ